MKVIRQELLIAEYFLILLFEKGLTPEDVAKNILDLNPRPYALLHLLLDGRSKRPIGSVTLDKSAKATVDRLRELHRLSQRLGAPLAPILKPLLRRQLEKGLCKKIRTRQKLLEFAIALNAGNGIVDAVAAVTDATHLTEKIDTEFYSADRQLRAVDTFKDFLSEKSLDLAFEFMKFGLAYAVDLVDLSGVLAGRDAL